MNLTEALVPLGIIVVLSGCSAAATPSAESASPASSSPQSSPAPTSTPTGIPTPAADTLDDGGTNADGDGDGGDVTDLVIDKISLQPYYAYFLNAEGQVVDSVWYGDAPGVAAAKFEAAFGAAPVTTPNAWDSTQIGRYDFGGVEVRADGYFTPFMGRRFTVEVSVATQSGVDVEAANGWHVGTPSGSIETQYGGYRDGGVMTVVVSLTPDEYNRIFIHADDPYTVITSFAFPDGA